jgi:hypothetical protein
LITSWLPRRSLLAETPLASRGQVGRLLRAAVVLVGSFREPQRISQEDQKDRRSEGGKSAFFNSEDRIEKYSSEVQKEKTSLQTAGGSANPQILGLLPF